MPLTFDSSVPKEPRERRFDNNQLEYITQANAFTINAGKPGEQEYRQHGENKMQ